MKTKLTEMEAAAIKCLIACNRATKRWPKEDQDELEELVTDIHHMLAGHNYTFAKIALAWASANLHLVMSVLKRKKAGVRRAGQKQLTE